MSKSKPNAESKKRRLTAAAVGSQSKTQGSRVSSAIKSMQRRSKNFLGRRPHRSFRRTMRRDYVRSLQLPGYVSFSAYVTKVLFSQKKLFGKILLFYVVVGLMLIGIASQGMYSQLTGLLDETANDWSALGQATLLLLSGLSGGFNPSLTEAQQIYSILLLLLVWLAVVWALRAMLAGDGAPKLRDILYNSAAPLVSTTIVFLIILIQLIPVALAIIIVNSARETGMFDVSVMSLIVSLVAGGLGLLSVYWITSSIIALVIVTLPGMYPLRAVQAAGDLVIGRRVRILLRLAWMMLCGVVFTVVILLPIILADRGIKQLLPGINWLPTIPVAMAFVSATVLIWSAAYVYLLYRKVVEDDADPA